ncbi:NAD(P)-dependent oxidoreductase [Schaalia naturae]|uniref:NAD(P)-dependent oxidoreductase n=2 Tax=Schaalia naturae TaxID=635203 RepID=A0ABW2SMN2_9ACTO
MKILISDTVAFGAFDVPDDVRVVPVDELQPVPPQHRDAEAVVIWGQNPDIGSFLADLPRLRWVQTLAAGPDALLALDLPPEVIITKGVHFHDKTVAEHALALALATLRSIPLCERARAEHRWATELTGPRPLHSADAVTTLIGSDVVVWGFGAIGQEIARRFSAMGARVTGIAHSAGERAGFPVVGSSPDEVDAALSTADVLVMVLPDRPDTRGALDEHTIGVLPDRAHVVNVGRGSGVDEDALASALREGRLGAAALDVASTEPLPAGSPLWDAPNIVITPHVAGNRPIGVEERVSHNVRALLGLGGEMIGVVQR